MIVDIDTSGRISITELSEQQAELIQNALLFLANRQQSSSAPSCFLRRVAIQIDRLLPKPPDRVASPSELPPPVEHQHLFVQRNHKQ